MNSKNMHYCYNVEYFQEALLTRNVPNKEIYDFQFQDSGYGDLLMKESALDESRKGFSLTTVYPGLFIGSGYPHGGSKNAKNPIIGGFFFDYVTGIPVIPGSSLKGALRSYFPDRQKPGEKTDAKKAMLLELLEKLSRQGKADQGRVNQLKSRLETTCNAQEENWVDLERNLFEERDVFLGGFPVIPDDKKIIDSEYITPHKDQFKNPIPISMVKVRPGVTFNFLFLLYGYKDVTGQPIMTADEKRDLYEELLLLGGIGAKTNVGFGQFMRQEMDECS